MNALLFNSTLVIYAAATTFYLGYLVKPTDVLGKLGRWCIRIGFLVHCGFTLNRYLEAGHTPITNLHESLSFFSLAVVGIFIVFESRYKSFILGSFVVPLALLILATSAAFSSVIPPLNPALKSKWLAVHTGMAFLGYAAFAISFGVSIMYLIQSHFLKKRKLGPMFQKLPPLDMLDDISYRCLTIGFPLLTFAIISGAIWAETAWGTYWSWDPKETWSLITWFIYAALLHGRLTTGWRGRKAAMLSIFGFFIVIFTFLGVNLLLGGLHSYK
ncbi:MAG: c-type cytochrome biogenesis protein CcsB [Geobacteraceae bacterium GWC2_58_44]|nr:MAG: c-type cytochrome biogenesis protein CcsB [Geobacteraceae bacterium GWC2_58_44]HBG06351.1 c-type cytochrome biogenesis protein CcsB [Geobacter sp.]